MKYWRGAAMGLFLWLFTMATIFITSADFEGSSIKATIGIFGLFSTIAGGMLFESIHSDKSEK